MCDTEHLTITQGTTKYIELDVEDLDPNSYPVVAQMTNVVTGEVVILPATVTSGHISARIDQDDFKDWLEGALEVRAYPDGDCVSTGEHRVIFERVHNPLTNPEVT